MPVNASIASEESLKPVSERLRKALESTRERLLDLTLRNSLLNFHDKGSRVVKIIKEIPDHIYDHMVERRQSMALLPKPDSNQEKDSPSNRSSDLGQLDLLGTDGNTSISAFQVASNGNKMPDTINEAIRKIEIAAAEDAYDKREEESGAEDLGQEDEVGSEDGTHLYDDFLQTTLEEEQLDGRMRRIQSDYKNILESTGSNLLFLALGFLEWHDPLKDPNKPRLAPLILLPIHLKRELESVPVDGPQGKRRAKTIHVYRYRLTYTGDDVSNNLTLALKLKKDFGLHLPEISKSGLDSPETYLLEVEKMLDGWKPPTKEPWKVLRLIRIGFFTFSKDVMYRDLDPENWPRTGLLKIPMVETVLDGRVKDPQSEVPLTAVEDCHKTQTIATVMDADSSQMKVLMRVSNGENLVVQGPPGTGKSQTITNMIASALYSGKKVLFMAEKMAALEVVRSRLDKADLGIYCLELHSKSSNVNAVHSQIRARLDRRSRRRTQSSIQEHAEGLNKFRRQLNRHCEIMGRTVEGLSCDIASLFWKAEQCKVRLRDALKRGGGKPEKVETPAFRLESYGAEKGPDSENLNDLEFVKNILRIVARHWNEGIPARGKVWNGFHADRLIDEQLVHIESILLDSLSHLASISSMQEKSLIPSIVSASSEVLWNVVGPLVSLGVPGNDFDQDAAKDIISSQVGVQDFVAFTSDLETILKQVQAPAYLLAHSTALSDSSFQMALSSIESLLKRNDQGGKTLEGLELLVANFKDADGRLERGRAIAKEVFADLGAGIVPRSPREIVDYLPWLETFLSTEDEVASSASTLPFSQNIRRYLELAQNQHRALLESRKQLEKYFVIEDSPDPKLLGEIRKDLRESRNTWKEWLPFTKISKAKKSVRRFSRSQDKFTSDVFLDALSGLEKIPANEVEFSSDSNLRRQLGSLFQGNKSNWVLLESAIELHEFVYKKIGDSELSKHIITQLPKLFERKSEIQNKIKGIRAELSNLNELLPSSKTTPPDAYMSSSFDDLGRLLSKHIIELGREGSNIRAAESDLQTSFLDSREVILKALDIRKCISRATQFLAKTKYYKRNLYDINFDQLNALSRSLTWIQKVQDTDLINSQFSNWLFEQNTTDRYQALLQEITSIKVVMEKWISSISNLKKYGESELGSCFSSVPSTKRATELHFELKAAVNEIDLLLRWTDYQRSLRSLKETGTIHILDFARQYQILADDLEIVADASFFVQKLKKLLRECPELWEFERVNHEVALENFYTMDKRIPDIFCQEVAVRAHKSENEISAGIGSGSVTTFTDMALIRRELEKQRRHIPVRELVRRSHTALLDLMPCWMMGPGSVSQFLPPELIEFDLLIMDEASQIRPEDALGSLARVKQVVVVGDKNQMPPTDMFTTNLDGSDSDEDESPVADMKSVLDNLTQYLQEESLIWHYRSQHHSLIQFSNSRYYDSKLIVPPSAYRGREDLGIKWHFVENPSYSNSLNPGEANLLIRHLSSHVTKNSHLPKVDQESIGLVVMNVKQRMLLEELWDRQLRDDDGLRKAYENYKPADPVFIKNLENIQGDERDVIVIGFTYGPDLQTGVLAHRFGPINKDGGWRRLNVLFTRARKRVHVYSSMRASDIVPNVKEGKRGAGDLKAYLEFAESGKIPDFGKRTGKGPDSPFEVSVANIVASLGYEAHYQVGVDSFLVDIGVCDPKNPDFYLCGIECDGAPYHSHPVARDRDRLREEILRSRGWKIHRIWSTDWYRNRKTEIERLTKALRQLVA